MPVQQKRRPVRPSGTRRRPIQREERPTPILLRVLSWLGIILLCFVIGYLGTSWVVDILNRKLLLKPEDRIENATDLMNHTPPEPEPASEIPQASLTLYFVNDDALTGVRKTFIARSPEDNIRDAIDEVLSLSDFPNIKLLHVFRIGDTAFLDLPGQFSSSLENAPQRKGLLLLTGIIRTLQDNFPPLKQVKFLIDSKAPKSGSNPDLSVTWKMP